MKKPDWQMNDLAVEYGTDYSQFYMKKKMKTMTKMYMKIQLKKTN